MYFKVILVIMQVLITSGNRNCGTVDNSIPSSLPVPSGCPNGEDYCEEDPSYPDPDLVRKIIRAKSTEMELSLLFEKQRILPSTDYSSETTTSITTTTTTPAPTNIFSPSECQDGWTHNPASGACYKILEEKMNWEVATSRCASLDRKAKLAAIKSCQEYHFVKDLLISTDKRSKYWLGGSDIENEGSWVWTDGSPVIFSGWHKNEPNDFRRNNGEDCLVWGWKKNYLEVKWNDVPCKSKNYAVCKISGYDKYMINQQPDDQSENPTDCESVDDYENDHVYIFQSYDDYTIFADSGDVANDEYSLIAPADASYDAPAESGANDFPSPEVYQEISLCSIFESFQYPKVAKNLEGKWRWVVNVAGDNTLGDNYFQAVKVDQCNYPGEPCDTNLIGTVCKQKKSVRKLVVITEKAKTVIDSFSFPSCCVCYKKEFYSY